MFRGAGHIVPIFMRIIAGLLAQSGLLPQTHPAVLYGEPGVEKCSFAEMLGDAWYSLRMHGATPYQWSVFSSVLLIIFFVISSIVMTIINLSTVFVTSASAQVFANWNGASDFTTLNTVNTAVLWDKTFPGPSTGASQTDYALAFLNAMLRYGAAGKGGPLQNAVGAMMQIYNSGIMVIAGIMLFWLILSVVVDTAKTGQLGGGRHNMVWAPIRIIFALGLMIPLGANGFSSGQFMVMKIAEYGSNLGSNAWHAYLTQITKDPLYKLPAQKNLMALTGKLLRSWVCIVASNGYSDQAEGANLPNAQIVYRYDNKGQFDNGQQSYSYRKLTGSNECGTISFPTVNDPTLTQQMALATGATNPITGISGANIIEQKKLQFQIDMATAWHNMFYAGASAPAAATGKDTKDGSPQTQIEKIANSFACGFVSQHIWGQDQGNGNGSGQQDVLHLNCTGGGAAAENGPTGNNCGAGIPASGQYPDMSCVEDGNFGSSAAIEDIMQATILKALQTNYNNDIAPLAAQLLCNGATGASTCDHGWADMGSFFEKLANINRFVLDQSKLPVHITPGSIPNEGGLSEKINEVVNKFDDWWQTVPMAANPNVTTAGSGTGNFVRNTGGLGGGATIASPNAIGVSPSDGGSGGGGSSHSSWISHVPVLGAVFGGVAAIAKLVNIFVGIVKSITQVVTSPISIIAHAITSYIHGDVIDLVAPDAQDQTVYPLTVLINLGHKLIAIGVGIHLALLGVVLLLSLIPMDDVAAAVSSSTVMTLLGVFGTVFLSCGATLSFWLPALPLIRVAFAVLTWGATVFEAVALVPIAALSFLSTTGEGWDAKHVFLNWLDVFTRPVLTVVGFVGSILLFNTFFSYFYTIFKSFMETTMSQASGLSGIIISLLAMLAYTVIFFMVIYSAANTCFKLISSIPDAFFRWAPIGGSRSGSGGSIGDGGDHSGAVGRMGGMAGESMGGATKAVQAGGEAAGKAKSAAAANAKHGEMMGSLGNIGNKLGSIDSKLP